MKEEDYESLPESSTVSTHMLAGAAAGVLEHSVMYPVDCVKTRMQCLMPDPRANYRSVLGALHQIVRQEGVRNTVRGISAVVGGAGPAHALYFACYEFIKEKLSGPQGSSNHLVHGFAGGCATLLHDAVMNPADVVKQRMQMYQSPYKTCMHCGRTILKQEGIRAFYRSYITSLTMNIPFQALHFICYEICQDFFNANRQYDPLSHVLSGAGAGAFAAAATTPLDVCKTLLNTQEHCAVAEAKHPISGMAQALRTVYRYHGLTGFTRGLSARVIYQMPSTAISWSVYEFFKFFITQRNATDGGYITPSTSTGGPVPLVAASSR